MSNEPIYLDYNATTPIDKCVADAMLPYLYGIYGNPSSRHAFGLQAKNAIEKARVQIAKLIGCNENEIVFTSGGTESNNLALKGAAYANRVKGNHIITSAIEHPAVLKVCDFLEKEGFRITILPVDENGTVKVDHVKAAICSQTILISIMHANNEIGTIEPIMEISEIAHRHNVIIHTDAAQSIGKIPVRVDTLGIDLLSVAGHKIYAPKGVGVLYIRNGTEIEKIFHGADHERSMRAGTENVLEIVGLGMAFELIEKNLSEYAAHYKKTRDLFEEEITQKLPWVKKNGNLGNRLPNTSNISFKGIQANRILSELTSVAASAGAACHTDKVKISHVLDAMHIPEKISMGTIRFSTGRSTTEKEIEKASFEVVEVIHKLQM
jgi:cysteine desulfurase